MIIMMTQFVEKERDLPDLDGVLGPGWDAVGSLRCRVSLSTFIAAKASLYPESVCRFGVCCVFIVTGTSATISQNCTYLQNPGFPSTYTDTTAITYTIQKCDNSECHSSNLNLD